MQKAVGSKAFNNIDFHFSRTARRRTTGKMPRKEKRKASVEPEEHSETKTVRRGGKDCKAPPKEEEKSTLGARVSSRKRRVKSEVLTKGKGACKGNEAAQEDEKVKKVGKKAKKDTKGKKEEKDTKDLVEEEGELTKREKAGCLKIFAFVCMPVFS